MKNGGYKVIDLKDNNLVTSAAAIEITGIHAAIENSYRKASLLSGIVIDGVEKNDAFITVTVSGSAYTISVYGKTITITSDDDVSIA